MRYITETQLNRGQGTVTYHKYITCPKVVTGEILVEVPDILRRSSKYCQYCYCSKKTLINRMYNNSLTRKEKV